MVLSVTGMLVDLSVAIMHVTVSVAVMQLKVSVKSFCNKYVGDNYLDD